MQRIALTIVAAAGLGLLLVACGGGGSSGTECGDGVCEGGEDGLTCEADCPICDNNGFCNVEGGENGLNCPGDCPVCVEDGYCNREGGEHGLNCPLDCVLCLVDGVCDTAAGETPANCGTDCVACNDDGVCDAISGETAQNCPGDCPICVLDGVCDNAGGETRSNCPADCPVCNSDGICEPVAGESNVNCPDDCVGFVDECDLAAMQAGPAPYDYIIFDLHIPTSSAEAGTIGTDLDGDGLIDNKLGSIMALLMSNGSADPNIAINNDIDQGDLVIPLRLYLDSWSADATVMVLAYEGEPTPTPPAFDGSDVVNVAAGSPTDIFLCGPCLNSDIDVGPGQLLIPLPLLSQTVFVPLQQAQVVGAVSQPLWMNVMVGGGVTETDVDQVILPALQAYFTDVLLADPFGTLADTLMNLFDSNCVDVGGVCTGIVNGVGDCAANLPTDPTPITLTELRCNALLNSALAPDVDSDNDGVDDLLSVGFQIQAMSATINTP